jgi:hypothetical protein
MATFEYYWAGKLAGVIPSPGEDLTISGEANYMRVTASNIL